ncbi:hypothetical protein CRG98_033780 [Punica granatum]|uniref:Uncharacterized protein n=1 Tax=Punica granatum TaxID=22663 RepID=A0A2I0IPY1_PUNGR|nr:hypothetical protein CRG98_033780 [Punica granatum]
MSSACCLIANHLFLFRVYLQGQSLFVFLHGSLELGPVATLSHPRFGRGLQTRPWCSRALDWANLGLGGTELLGTKKLATHMAEFADLARAQPWCSQALGGSEA